MNESKTPEPCEVCGNPLINGGWGIRHGMGVCKHCGATYMFTGNDAPKCTLTEAFKRLTQDYYQETGQPAVLIQHDGPVPPQSIQQFEDWFDTHKNNYNIQQE